MKKCLPEYICNCFEVTGFDTIDAICEMNSNSIANIESDIDKRKTYLPSCMRTNVDDISSMPSVEFPTGHRIMIF